MIQVVIPKFLNQTPFLGQSPEPPRQRSFVTSAVTARPHECRNLLLRDFKKHTAKKVIEAIENNPQESRKEWLLWMMKRAGKKQGNITNYQFWQHNNKPIELWSTQVIKQKIDYIHSNPIESGFVTNPVDWKYSSARNFQGDHTILQIDEAGFL